MNEWKDTIAFPRIIPLPENCPGIEFPVIPLDGIWTVRDSSSGREEKIAVPCDMSERYRAGWPKVYEYETRVSLAGVPAGCRIALRFEAVNGFADVSVDSIPVASHKNGFLAWNVEITEQVRGKSDFLLRVAMDDRDRVSTYNHGGILRHVALLVLPEAYLDAVTLTPLFDEDMKTCVLRAEVGLAGEDEAEVEVSACPPGGGEELSVSARVMPGECAQISLLVPQPVLWDAEHPRLYRVEIRLVRNGRVLETVAKSCGLRRVTRVGNRLYVNQREVKLRGVCRHEISPLDGRHTTEEMILQDVRLFKEANCNYIRTSHYPPSEYFLDRCDEYGIYVEDELALAFIGRSLPFTQRDPAETERYLSHFAECYARDAGHPSVIIWSICNESFGGYNFDAINRLIHRTDPTRVTKFSYPMTIAEEQEMPDIWSVHYAEYDADLAKKMDNVSVAGAPGRDLPVIHDEYAHVPCYNRDEIRRDPAVHAVWGESIRRFWDNICHTDGALGGAIWAGIDEVDVYSGGVCRLEWGILDVWRRKKPEFFMTRKAYSPIRLLHAELIAGRMVLVIENRFCHTDLSEIRYVARQGGIEWQGALPAACPCAARRVSLETPTGVDSTRPVLLSFYDPGGNCVEQEEIAPRGYQERILPPPADGGSAVTVESGDGVLVRGDGFLFRFDRGSGLLSEWSVGGKRLLLSGPRLNAPYFRLGDWKLTDLTACGTPEGAEVRIEGGYEGAAEVSWLICISRDGSFTTRYTVTDVKRPLPGEIKLRVGVDRGGLDELGIEYLADPSLDTLDWSRRRDPDGEICGAYPDDHIARARGTATRRSRPSVFGQTPVTSWAEDEKCDVTVGEYDVAYTGTNDFRATKEDVLEACLRDAGSQVGIGIERAGCDLHIRLEVADPEETKIRNADPRIRYRGTWYREEDAGQSDHGWEMWSREPGASAECRFFGTGIVWYGPQDSVCGMANVYLDGRLAAKVSQRSSMSDLSGSSIGFDKKYHIPIYSVEGLPSREHTIRIEATGEREPTAADCYIIIDYLRVLTDEKAEPTRLLLNQAFAFPHIGWGNYRRPPIRMDKGTTGQCVLRPVWGGQ